MALTKCKECGEKISNKAKVCPSCGAVPKKTSGCAGCLIICLLGFGGLFAIGAFNGGGNVESRVGMDEPKPAAVADQFNGRQESLDTFNELLQATDAKALVTKLDLKEHTLIVTVVNSWHYEPQQIRMQAAQNLWETWARVYAPKNVDRARLSVVDQNGNEVGGSRILGGSLIWVKD